MAARKIYIVQAWPQNLSTVTPIAWLESSLQSMANEIAILWRGNGWRVERFTREDD